MQDLYRFVFAWGISPPFLLFTSHPRAIISLSNSSDMLTIHHLNETVVMVEGSDPEEAAIDVFLDSLEVEVCRCI